MTRQPLLSRFKIEGLRSGINFDIEVADNTLIMVGENGSGKTTLLRILFYFLSCRWQNLLRFKFYSISATLNGVDYEILRENLVFAAPKPSERQLMRLPPAQRRWVRNQIELGHFDEATLTVAQFFRDAPASWQREFSFMDGDAAPSAALIEMQERLSNTLGSQVLYLPTYRRIERELSSILQGFEPEEIKRPSYLYRQQEDANDYVELVEFGMNDVKKSITSTIEAIRSFQLAGITRLSLSYLSDVVGKKYLSSNRSIIESTSTEKIDAILNRVDNTILNDTNKNHVRDIIISAKDAAADPTEHEKIIYHYLTKLIHFQSQLESKEKNIRSFCELCSEYIKDKKFLYDSVNSTFQIASKRSEGEIDISELSSGEKQIVSLFSHLYLSGKDRFFVLIDEPELSLSVPWQRRFLIDIADASFCAGLIAVTHSPFVYDNKLRKFAHALGEYTSGPDWGGLK